jgi:translation initiation factor 2B subunit (eIF-2B alpha/beta/delta family)
VEPSIERAIEEIASDKTHGAAQLAGMGLDLMARACAAATDTATTTTGAADEALAGIARLARRIDGRRPSMAAPGNWALIFLAELRERLKSAPGGNMEAAGRELAEALKARLSSHAGRMADAARPMLAGAGAILTLSDSSSVEEVIKTAAPAACTIFAAESRPLLEGRRLIERLRESGRDARCVTDAGVGLIMREADVLLLGADTICRDAAIVNKTGSLPAALAARRFGKPCAAAADTFKISGRVSSDDAVLERGPGGEVWPEAPEICENTVFETVPADLITCFITEKGILAHHLIREEAKRWRRIWERSGEVGSGGAEKSL